MEFDISQYKYIPCFKTKDGEIKAYSQLDQEVKNNILPLIELTRGKKSKNDTVGLIDKRIDQFKDIIDENYCILDLTSQEQQQNEEIENLLDPYNGFDSWVKFVKEINRTYNIIPIAHVSPEKDLEDDIILQVNNLLQDFNFIAVRLFGEDEESGNRDIVKFLSEKFTSNLNKFLIIIDSQYIRHYDSLHTNSNIEFINYTKKLGYRHFCIMSSSYPKNIVETVGEDYHGKIKSIENNFYNDIANNCLDTEIKYGDYASIHPFVNDNIARTPIPKIEFVSNGTYSYYRKRHQIRGIAYSEIAKSILNDNMFKSIPKCWGKKMIEDASQENVFAKNATNWIAVKMNIYITVKFNELLDN